MYFLKIRFITRSLKACFTASFQSIRYETLKASLTMNTIYFRHVDGDEDFHVTFRYLNQQLGVDKQLNLCRKLHEPCELFMSRVNTNLEKVINKKLKVKKKKTQTIDESVLPELRCVLLKNGQPVNGDETCEGIFKPENLFELLIGEDRFRGAINVPWVETITLPKGIMAGFPIYPSKLQGFYFEKQLSKSTWFSRMNHKGPWIEVGRGAVFIASAELVGHHLRVLYEPHGKDGRIGPIAEALSPDPIQAGPGISPFEIRHQFTSTKLQDIHFRVISYNILADLYVDSEYSRTVLFGYCPAYALELTYRRQLLLKELLGYNGDLLCLQEVDSKVFKHDLEPFLNEKGMQGIFSKKGETVNEGCAVFYDTDKFQLVDSWRNVLGSILPTDPVFSDIWDIIKKQEGLVERITQRSTTLQTVLLESRKVGGEALLVANTHLYFHPDADHIRLLQGILCMKYIQHLLAQIKAQSPHLNISVIFCGDFNSVPECGIYQLYTTGSVESDHIDWTGNESEAVSDVSYHHKLLLKSACGTPKFTNYTLGFKACLDYIFYQNDRLSVKQVVPLPSEEELSAHGAIPSVLFPSDHIALIADLSFKADELK